MDSLFNVTNATLAHGRKRLTFPALFYIWKPLQREVPRAVCPGRRLAQIETALPRRAPKELSGGSQGKVMPRVQEQVN